MSEERKTAVWRRAAAAGCAAALLLTSGGAVSQGAPAQADGRTSPFYQASGALPERPGAMLRTEPLPAELGLSAAGEQKRILYTSTDGIRGSGVLPVSGVLFLPKGEPPVGGWPLIAWAHGTVGIADSCAPSWAGRSARDATYLNAWLQKGYAIVATDYQGLGTPGVHPYLQTRPEAFGVLDGIRAVQSADPRLAKKVVVIGQSQGGGAAFAAASIQPAYAPDVLLVAAVTTGPPYVTPAVLARKNPDPTKVDPALAYLFYLGLTAGGPDAPEQIFTPAALPVVEKARTECVFDLEAEVKSAGLSQASALKPLPFLAFARRSLPALSFSSLRPNVPVFIGTGGRDTDVPPEGQRALVRASCAAGATVERHEYADKDHSGAFAASLPDAMNFVDRVLSGKSVPGNCGSAAGGAKS